MKVRKITKALLRPLLPRRAAGSHKGDYGRLLVVAGSRGMTGAAVLAARAALRAGAGLVTVACPEGERALVARSLPEAITCGAAQKGAGFSLKAVRPLRKLIAAKKIDAVLIGPGLSMDGETPLFVIDFLNGLKDPVIIDADALNAISNWGRFPKIGGPVIILPHPGEAARLLGAPGKVRAKAVISLAALCRGVAVLKGNGTLVSDGESVFENPTGGPELAKGGSGDALAGLCAGLFVQAGLARGFTKKTALETAALAVYLHGVCGELAAKEFTERGVLASDLIDRLPAAFRKAGAKR